MGLPFPPPYGFTQLGGLIIDSLMTSHMLREPVGIGGKKRKQQQQKKSRTNKSRPCLKALWCVINRCSSPSATDCQLPPSSEDQRDSWRTPPTSKARNATDTYEPGRSRAFYVAARVRVQATHGGPLTALRRIFIFQRTFQPK